MFDALYVCKGKIPNLKDHPAPIEFKSEKSVDRKSLGIRSRDEWGDSEEEIGMGIGGSRRSEGINGKLSGEFEPVYTVRKQVINRILKRFD